MQISRESLRMGAIFARISARLFQSRMSRASAAVSTGGASPVVARAVRERIEEEIGPEWGELVALLRATREELKQRYLTMPERAAAVERLLTSDILDRLARGDRQGAHDLIAEYLGTPVP